MGVRRRRSDPGLINNAGSVSLSATHFLAEVAAALWVDVPLVLSPGRLEELQLGWGWGDFYSPLIIVTH